MPWLPPTVRVSTEHITPWPPMTLRPKQARVGDPALIVPRVDAVHKRTHALREVIGGADVHVRHVHDVAGRATEEVQETRREVDAVDLADQTSPMSLPSPKSRVSTAHIMPHRR